MLLPFIGKAQVDSTKYLQVNSTYGFSWNFGEFRNGLKIPVDTPKLAARDSGAVSLMGGSVWRFTGLKWERTTAVAVTDTALIYAIVAQSMGSAIDTSYKLNDSTFVYHRVNGTEWTVTVPGGSGGGVGTELDPVYSASSWFGTTNNSSNWNTAYGWGNHTGLYPLLAGSYSNPSWITALAWSKITGVPAFLLTETDPVYSGSSWFSTTNNSSNWNTAFGWGNHSGLYPLLAGSYNNPTWLNQLAWSKITGAPSFLTTESDPLAVKLAGSYADPSWITSLGWNKITGAPSFLTVETDPIYSASTWFGTTNNAANWNSAFSWGNHAGLYSALGHVHSAADVTSGTLAIARGGTGLSSIGTPSQLLRVSAGGTALEYFSPNYETSLGNPSTNGYVLSSTTAGVRSWVAPATGGAGADALGSYIVKTAANAPANAQVLASLSTGLMKVTTSTGAITTATAGTDYALPNANTTGTSSNVTGIVAIANGGTGQSTAPLARTALGATTIGSNYFTLTNPSAITFPRMNADNTVSSLTATDFRTAIGAGTSSTTGTVTTASVVSANGLGGTVATASTTPAITLSTSVNGMVKGNGTAFSAATVRTDYAEPTTALATGILKNTTTTGAHTIAVAGTDYVVPSGSITGSAATLTTSRNIAMTGDVAWNVNFNGGAAVTAAGTLATVNGNVGTFGNSVTVPTITTNGKGLTTAISQTAIPTANTSTTGLLTSTDWNTFNNKQALLVSNTNIKTVNGISLLGSGDVSTSETTEVPYIVETFDGAALPANFLAIGTPTYNVSGGELAFSSTGSTTYTKYVRSTKGVLTEQNTLEGTFAMKATPSSTTQGVAFGFQSYNSWGYTESLMFGLVTKSDDPNFGKVYLHSNWSSFTAYGAIGNTNINLNDVITLTVDRKGSVWEVVARNITQNWTVRLDQKLTAPLTPFVPYNSAYPTIYHLGGSVNVTDFSYTINKPKGKALMIVGNSITLGQGATNTYRRFVSLVGAVDQVIYSGGGADVSELVVLRLPEIVAINPYAVVMHDVAGNDIAFGVLTATWQANLTTINNTLKAAGIKVIWTTGQPRNGTDMTAQKTYIESAFSGELIADTYSALLGSGTSLATKYDSGDGTHPGDLGNQTTANVINATLGYGEVLLSKVNQIAATSQDLSPSQFKAGAFLNRKSNDSTKYMQTGYYDTYGYLQSVSEGLSYDKIVINPFGGNVGIGTLAPATSTLDVHSGETGTSILARFNKKVSMGSGVENKLNFANFGTDIASLSASNSGTDYKLKLYSGTYGSGLNTTANLELSGDLSSEFKGGLTVQGLNDATGVAKMATVTNGVFGYQAIPGAGGLTMGNIGSSPNDQGGTISGGILTLQPAGSLNGGIISNGNQIIPGAKTFPSFLATGGYHTALYPVDSRNSSDTDPAMYVYSSSLSATTKGLVAMTGAASSTTVIMDARSNSGAAGHTNGVRQWAVFGDGTMYNKAADDGTGVAKMATVTNGIFGYQAIPGGGSGVTTLAPVGSSPNGDGATISGNTLTLQPAGVESPGVVTASDQEFSGNKTYNDNVTIKGGLLTMGISDVVSGEMLIHSADDAHTRIISPGTLTAPRGYSLPDNSGVFAVSANGVATSANGDINIPGVLLNVRFLTSGTTYTPTLGTTKALLHLVGAGGGGGGVSGVASGSAGAAGGGAGGYVIKYITNISGTYAYTIGAAGTAGAAGANTGGTGGNTTFVNSGTTYTASGGVGGAGMTSVTTATATVPVQGGNGGAAANGDLNEAGEAGAIGMHFTAVTSVSGKGGTSNFGAGGKQGISSATAAGSAGTGYGAGGSGAVSSGNQTAAGGAGSGGLIIIYEYK